MSVVARKRKNGIEYYVCNYIDNRQAWEHVGREKRDAERRDSAMKREIAAGTYVSRKTGAATVRSYAIEWFRKRTGRHVKKEQSMFDFHVKGRCPWFLDLRMDDIRRAHALRLIEEIKAPYESPRLHTPFQLSRKSVSLIYSNLNTMFGHAANDENSGLLRNPFAFNRGERPSKKTRKRSPYELHEVTTLTTDPRIIAPARMFAALLFYTGMRLGEAAGRRWRDYDSKALGLGLLNVWSQYDDQPLKTGEEAGDAARMVPVHPTLAAALKAWRETGFELTYGRPPTDEDFIVPMVGKMHKCHSESTGYRMFRRACEVSGVKMHTVHATRNTFISLCRRGKCYDPALEKVTHNAKGDIIDGYTEFDWAPLCEAVLCFGKGAQSPERPPANLVVLHPMAATG